VWITEVDKSHAINQMGTVTCSRPIIHKQYCVWL